MRAVKHGDAPYAVVVPAFNEVATIAEIAARAARQCGIVIVVDDGSTDGTADALAGLPVTVLRNERNVGKGESLWRGMQLALAHGVAGVVTLDGDGQHIPEDIPRLLRVARAHPDALVIGARVLGRAEAPHARAFANRCANFWIGWASGQSLDDSQSGFRVYPESLLRRVEVKRGPTRGFVFESEVLIAASQLGVWARSVPIAALYPRRARPSHFRAFRDVFRITRMVAWQLLRRGMYLAGLRQSLIRRGTKQQAASETG